MKILVIEHFSAGNEYSLELCKNLAEHADITLLTVDNSMLKEKVKYKCKKILCGYGHPLLKRIAKYASGIWLTMLESIWGKYDIIHVQTFRMAYVEIILYMLVKLSGKKIVYTVHNVLPHEAKVMDKFFYSLMYNISDALVVHNEATADVLKREFKQALGKIAVIPHGAYDSYSKSGFEGRTADRYTVNLLQIGKIRDYKGADILIKAAAVVPHEYRKRLNITIAGKQEYDFDFDDLIKKEAVDDVVSIRNEFLPSEEIARLFGNSDACIFPYREVYGSGALLLSYTFGVPVIASDIPTFIEETDSGGAGLLFKSEDEHDLADKIVEFMDMSESERNRFSRRIRNLVDTKYNWKNSAALTVRLYESIKN